MLLENVPLLAAKKMKPSDEQKDLSSDVFLRLLAEHDRQLSAFVHIAVPRWQDAEDVLQDTKLRLWKQFESYQRGTDFAAWAFTVAGYMVRTHRKRCQRQRVCFDDNLLEKILQNTHLISPLAGSGRQSALAECVHMLDRVKRKLLHLVYAERKKTKDIAQALGQPPSTIRVTLLRIRQSLYRCVQKRMQEEDGE
jgi:RNA polymerase sigma-70 factor, ECF subfamily